AGGGCGQCGCRFLLGGRNCLISFYKNGRIHVFLRQKNVGQRRKLHSGWCRHRAENERSFHGGMGRLASLLGSRAGGRDRHWRRGRAAGRGGSSTRRLGRARSSSLTGENRRWRRASAFSGNRASTREL